MTVEEFFSLMDALRFDTDLDETNPELRSKLQYFYPVFRKIYNELCEAGYCGLDECKVNEARLKKAIMESVERTLENIIK